MAQSLYSDYQEVDGKFMAFTQVSKYNGNVGLQILMKEVSFNVEVDETIFQMPEE